MIEVTMTPEIAKSESQKYLRKHGIQVNEHLPHIESVSELKPQNAEAVARRCVILGYVIGIAYGADVRKFSQYLTDGGLIKFASLKEKELLSRATHTEQEKNRAGWLAESVQGLAWCLGLVELDPLVGCDDDLATHFPKPFVDPSAFIANAKLRPFYEIYQQADLHYRLHWAARNARLMGEVFGVKEVVLMNRRKAIDWAVGVENDWDEISVDT